MMKRYYYLVVAFTIIFLIVVTVFTTQNHDITHAAAQIESNSTFTSCINGKCVTTTTTCIVNAILLDRMPLIQMITILPLIITIMRTI